MKIGLVGLGRMGAAIWQRLKERGCEVVAWDRSAKAARHTLAEDHDFDLVLLDLQLGDADGFDVLTEFRSSFPSLPVVVVSSRSGNKHKQQATELGATDYLIKPFSPEIIRAALDRNGLDTHGWSRAF